MVPHRILPPVPPHEKETSERHVNMDSNLLLHTMNHLVPVKAENSTTRSFLFTWTSPEPNTEPNRRPHLSQIQIHQTNYYIRIESFLLTMAHLNQICIPAYIGHGYSNNYSALVTHGAKSQEE